MKTFDDLVNTEVNRIEVSRTLLSDDTAEFSPCGTYRYWLTRELGGDRPLVDCGLNPSTATAEINDQTIRKNIGFARRWGCGRLVKTNAYGFRATDPNVMKRARKSGIDIVGPGNDAALLRAVELVRLTGGILLVTWGAHIEPERQRELARIFGDLAMCLGTNGDGSPRHPLYLKYETPLVPWRCP